MVTHQFLPWDSKFFKKKIAEIHSTEQEPEKVNKIINLLFEEGCELIYLHSIYSFPPINYECLLVDNKRSYLLENPVKVDLPNRYSIILHQGDPEILFSLALQAGEYSRYKIDPNFSNEEFENLYKQWIINSINKKFADYVVVAWEKNQPIGLITARVKGEYLSIGLLATDNKYRCKGVGTLLIQQIINIAADNKLKVEVTTQANNKNACEFYEHRGFRILSDELIYHIWKN